MSSLPPLPDGWTEHTAPSGQKYYWHKESRTSTYKRPPASVPSSSTPATEPQSLATSQQQRWETALSYAWVGETDWLRVTTNRHHRFFFNPATRVSAWDPPGAVLRLGRAPCVDTSGEAATAGTATATVTAPAAAVGDKRKASDDDARPKRTRVQRSVSPPPTAAAHAPAPASVAHQLDRPGTLGGRTGAPGPGAPTDDLAGARPGPHAADANVDADAGVDAGADADAGSRGGQHQGDGDGDQDVGEARYDYNDGTNDDGDDDADDAAGGGAAAAAADDDDDDEEEEDEEEDEDEWQLQMAAEMAAEAEAAEAAERAAAEAAAAAKSPVAPGAQVDVEAEAAGAAATDARAEADANTKEESAVSLFFAALTSLNGTGQEVNPMAPWEVERRKFEQLDVYARVPESEREDAFNEWCKLRIREKRAARQAGQAQQTGNRGRPRPASQAETLTQQRPQARAHGAERGGGAAAEGEGEGEGDQAQAKSSYMSLLRECVTSTRTRWTDFASAHASDERFVPDERAFKAHLRALGETKRRAAQRAEEAFLALLAETRADARAALLAKTTALGHGQARKQAHDTVAAAWPQSKAGLHTDPRYDAVGSSTRRAQLWIEYVLGSLHSEGKAPVARDADGEQDRVRAQNAQQERTPGSQSVNGTLASAPALVPALAPKVDETKKRKQEAALAERAASVARRQAGVADAVRRAAGAAEHETHRLLYEQRLVDKVHDAYAVFTPAMSQHIWGAENTGARGSAGVRVPLPLREQEALFAAHTERLLARKGAELDALFTHVAPRLDVSVDEVVPHVKEAKDFVRLGLDRYVRHVAGDGVGSVGSGDNGNSDGDLSVETALERYFEWWNATRMQRAKDAFYAMLRENAFLDFWGRLQKTKVELRGAPQRPDHGGDGVRPQDQSGDGDIGVEAGASLGAGSGAGGDDGDEEDMEQDLLGMKFDLDAVRAVLADDARYLAFAHRPAERDAWIEQHIAGLRASKRAVRQRD